MCLTHPQREVLERFPIELVELNTLKEITFCVNFSCVKSTILFGKTIFDIAMQLVQGAIKPLHVIKHLKF